LDRSLFLHFELSSLCDRDTEIMGNISCFFYGHYTLASTIVCEEGLKKKLFRKKNQVKMTYSSDLRWRAVVLYYTMGMEASDVSCMLGVGKTTLQNWCKLFDEKGNVEEQHGRNRAARWPQVVYNFVEAYINEHPCFYFDELEQTLRQEFPAQVNFSPATICRALRFDMNMSRKVLEKHARESLPREREEYADRLKRIYQYPEQLVFIDETSKDGRAALRRYAWSHRGTKAVVEMPFTRGQRVSAIAAMSSEGFIAWSYTTGTFTRASFHTAMIEKVVPKLQRYPLPNSIVIMDNAKIHMYAELVELIESKGAMLVFLPPYSPQLNPIEAGFGLVKGWIQKHAHLVFHFAAENVLDIAFRMCASEGKTSLNLFAHAGYLKDGLKDEMFI
jgi:transposase